MVAVTSPTNPKRNGNGPGNPIPIATKLAIRSFYVLQGLSPSQIAPLVSLAPKTISQLAHREGWKREQTAKRGKLIEKTQKLQDTHANFEAEAIQKAIAIRTEELAVKTADRCADILGNADGIDDKALQMSSGALRNFVQVARMSRGMDSRGPQNAPGNGPQSGATLIFVGALERATPKELKPAELPAIEVSAKSPELT